jgi:cell envelope opacity-associated protein A
MVTGGLYECLHSRAPGFEQEIKKWDRQSASRTREQTTPEESETKKKKKEEEEIKEENVTHPIDAPSGSTAVLPASVARGLAHKKKKKKNKKKKKKALGLAAVNNPCPPQTPYQIQSCQNQIHV